MNIGVDLGFPAEMHSYQPDERLVLPLCRLGLEFEFEKVNRQLPANEAWTAYWQAKRDGSLHDAGMEFVFRQPLFGKDAVLAVQKLCEFAIANKLQESIRTGLHVHHDARDMTLQQLTMECVLYALYERAVYNYVGNNREENVFCFPWYQSHGAALGVRHIVNSVIPQELKDNSAAIAEEKYAGLNLDTLARFGSVEWRHALVSKDVGRILDWVNVVLRFKEAAIRLDFKDPREIIARVSHEGARGVAQEVFLDQFPLIDYPLMEEHASETGIPTALDILTVRKFSGWESVQNIGANPSFRSWAEAQKGKKDAKNKKPPSGDAISRADVDRAMRIFRERAPARAAQPQPRTRRVVVNTPRVTPTLDVHPWPNPRPTTTGDVQGGVRVVDDIETVTTQEGTTVVWNNNAIRAFEQHFADPPEEPTNRNE